MGLTAEPSALGLKIRKSCSQSMSGSLLVAHEQVEDRLLGVPDCTSLVAFRGTDGSSSPRILRGHILASGEMAAIEMSGDKD